MVFLAILISIIIAFLLRILDVFIIFLESGIKLSFIDSILVFLILLKAFKKHTKLCIKKKDWNGVKNLIFGFLFNFHSILVVISSCLGFAMDYGIIPHWETHDKRIEETQSIDVMGDNSPLLNNTVVAVLKEAFKTLRKNWGLTL